MNLSTLKSESKFRTAVTASWLLSKFERAAPPFSLTSYFEDIKLPPGWENRSFSVPGNLHVECYALPLGNARAHLRISLGFNAGPLLLLQHAPLFEQQLKKMGCSAVIMAPPCLDKQKDFLDTFLETAELFFTDPYSPANLPGSRDVPNYAVTHSVSGMLFQTLMSNTRTADAIKENLTGAIHLNSFFDSAGSSPLTNHNNHKIYMRHSHHYRDHIAGTALLDRVWLHAIHAKRDDDPACHRNPIHGQVRKLKEHGLALIQNLKKHDDFPQAFVISDNDPYACPQTCKRVAQEVNGRDFYLTSGHNALASDTLAAMSIIDMHIRNTKHLFVPPPMPQPIRICETEAEESPRIKIFPKLFELISRSFAALRGAAQAAKVDLPESAPQAR